MLRLIGSSQPNDAVKGNAQRMMKPQLDVDDVSQLLNLPKSSVYALAASTDGDAIPHVRLGRLIRFDPDNLERWWRRKQGDRKSVV